MIDVTDLHKSFRGTPVLRGLSLRVEKGELLALMGPSGDGKSVFLKHVVGLLRPDRGRVMVDGRDVSALRGRSLERLRNRVGFLFQGGALFASMTVFENVAFPLAEKTHLSRAEVRDRVMQQLEHVGLTEAAEKRPAELSGGMVKRAALARALVTAPEIMLFDEPTTGLDPVILRAIIDLIGALHERLRFTGIIVTHDIPDVFRIVGRVAMLQRGQIHAVGTPAEVLASPDPLVRNFIRGDGGGENPNHRL